MSSSLWSYGLLAVVSSLSLVAEVWSSGFNAKLCAVTQRNPLAGFITLTVYFRCILF